MSKTKKTVLVVDDTDINIDILLGLLEEEYDLLVALNGQQALEIVREEAVDLILLDIMMPEMSGFEVCAELKRVPETRDIPVIFITAKSDDASIEEAFETGGVDYVTKPFKPVELRARIKTHLILRQALQELDYLANHDSLTGVCNRRRFFEMAESLVATQAPVYAVMLDIDAFKSINDTYGRAAGDAALKLTARTIQSHLQETALLGRLGGQKFAIVGLNDGAAMPLALTESLRRAVAELRVHHSQGELGFTLNTGVALQDSATPSLDALLREAESALSQARQNGGSRLVLRENG